MTLTFPRKTLISTTLIATLSLAATPVLSGPGNSGSHGGGGSHGNSGSSHGSSVSASSGGGSSQGALASSLRKLNGVVHANDMALENASDSSVHGLARTWRDAEGAISTLDGQIGTLQDDIAALGGTRTDEDIQAEIDALNPDDYAAEEDYNAAVAALEAEKDTAPSQAELDGQIQAKQDEIDALNGQIGTLQGDRDAAWLALTDGRDLSDDAIAALKEKLGME